jgi:hypothetical protein
MENQVLLVSPVSQACGWEKAVEVPSWNGWLILGCMKGNTEINDLFELDSCLGHY